MSHVAIGVGKAGYTGAGGTVSTSPILEYLRPDVMRPDLYEQQSFIVKDIHGPSTIKESKTKASSNYISTLIIIVVSAFIFVTVVAWFDVIRSYFDSKYINDVIKAQTKARIVYALTCLVILIVAMIVLYFVWKRYTQHLQ